MTKLINGRKLSKSLKVIFKSFPGSKIQDMKHYTKPALQQKPDKVILHVGTNNIKKLPDVITGIKQEHPNATIAVSSIIRRNDAKSDGEKKLINQRISEVNHLLNSYCKQNSFDFISNRNIDDSCLNAGVHLDHKGIYTLANNLRNYMKCRTTK